jgi:hypothetical protein
MRDADIRKWSANQRAAAQRELAVMRHRPLSPSDAFASALALLALDESLNGSPFHRVDSVSVREDQELRDAWAKLRTRWPRER